MKKLLAISILSFIGLSVAQLGVPSSYKDTAVVTDSSKMIWQFGPPWVPAKLRSMNYSSLAAQIAAGGSGATAARIHDSLVAHGLQASALPALKHVCTAGAGVLTTVGCGVDTSGGVDSLTIGSLIHDSLLIAGKSGDSNFTLAKLAVGTTTPAITSQSQVFIGMGVFGAQNVVAGEMDIGDNFYYNGGWKRRIGGMGESRLGFNSTSPFTRPGIDFYIGDSGAVDGTVTWVHAGKFNESANLVLDNSLSVSGTTQLTGKVTGLDTSVFVKDRATYGQFATALSVGGAVPDALSISTARIEATGDAGRSGVYALNYSGTNNSFAGGSAGGSLASPTASTNGTAALNVLACSDTASGPNTWACGSIMAVLYQGTQSFTNRGKAITLASTDSGTLVGTTYMRAANKRMNFLGAVDTVPFDFRIKGKTFIDSTLYVKGALTVASCTGCAAAGTVTSSTLTAGTIPIATGANAIGNSALTYATSTFNFGSNAVVANGLVQGNRLYSQTTIEGTDSIFIPDLGIPGFPGVHFLSSGDAKVGHLHASSAEIDTDAAVGGMLTVTGGASISGGNIQLGLNSTDSVFLDAVASDDNGGGEHVLCGHDKNASQELVGNCSSTSGQTIAAGVYYIPSSDTAFEISGLSGYQNYNVFVDSVNSFINEVTLPSTANWPAGKVLWIKGKAFGPGGTLAISTVGPSETIDDDEDQSTNYQMVRSSTLYSVALVHGEGSLIWEILSTTSPVAP